MQLFFDELHGRGCCECFYLFTTHFKKNTWQQTDIQRMHYLSASSIWQEQKTCWYLGFEMPFSSLRLQWLGELLFFLSCHWTLCEEKLTLSPLCLAEGLSLTVQVQIAVLVFLLQHWPSLGQSLLNGTSGLSVVFLVFPSSSHFHRPQGCGFLTPTASH